MDQEGLSSFCAFHLSQLHTSDGWPFLMRTAIVTYVLFEIGLLGWKKEVLLCRVDNPEDGIEIAEAHERKKTIECNIV